METYNSRLLALPVELIEMIIGFLPLQDLSHFSRTNRELHSLTLKPIFRSFRATRGISLVSWAIYRGYVTMIQRVIETGLEECSFEDLVVACQCQQPEFVELLLTHPTVLEGYRTIKWMGPKEIYGGSPLHQALANPGRSTIPCYQDAIVHALLSTEEGRNDVALTSLSTLGLPYEKFIQPAICVAVKRGLVNCVRKLLTANPSCVNAVDEDHETPLMLAMQKKDLETMVLLLEAGADSSVRNGLGQNIMVLAAYAGPDWVDLLLSYGISVTHTDEDGANALFGAAMAGHNELVTYLLDLGVDPTVRTTHGSCILHEASFRCWPSTIKTLIDRGVDVNCTNNANKTPLHYFLSGNRHSVANLEVLLKAGADPSIDRRYFDTWFPIEETKPYDCTILDRIKLFHKYGAGLDTALGPRVPCLFLRAFDAGRVDVLEYLTEHMPTIVNFSPVGEMFHLHGRRSQPLLDVTTKEMAGWILAHSKLNDTDHLGRTIMHQLASINVAGWIFKMFVHAGADVMATDNEGDTPLHLAIWLEWNHRINEENIETLMKNGADALAVNRLGETPLIIAERQVQNLGPGFTLWNQAVSALDVITKQMTLQAKRKREEL